MESLSLRVVPLVAALLLASVTAAQQLNFAEGGYADRRSVPAGGAISFHIASATGSFNVEIVNMAAPNTVLQRITGLTSQSRDCTGLWESGCGWPVTTSFSVPSGWTPGYYAARFPTSLGTRYILFVVRAAIPGSYAPVAVIQPTYTDTAYNRFGGKSVYDTISTNSQRAHIVSFQRPYYDAGGLSRFPIWEQPFVDWMKSEGRTFEVITDDDMEAGISLAAYKAILIVGHSEYWSLNTRRHLEQFSAAGGHVAIFGGNTMWWQVRTDLQSAQMTVYKDAGLDPMTGVDDDVVTTNWYDWPVSNPENRILGASFLHAGYVNKYPDPSFERLPVAERVPYTVRRAAHWVFEGTGLTDGAEMGRSIAAIEVDGVIFNTLPSGETVVEGSDGTPLHYELLATVPASYGYGTIGMYTNASGGAVFNGAARDWSLGLAGDPIVQRMTRNVLDRFATGAPFAYAPRTSPNLAEDLFNTPVPEPGVLPGWQRDMLGFSLTARCAFEGPTGLEYAGTFWTQLLRRLHTTGEGVAEASANIRINLDLLERSPNYPSPLFEFVDRESGETYVAALEMMLRPEGRSLRLASYDGTTQTAVTDWIVPSSGWHSVTMTWRSPGEIELNVSGTRRVAFNSVRGQKMNAVLLEFAGSRYGSSGSVCVDRMQVRSTFGAASGTESRIVATPESIPADGSSTAAIVVQLFDDEGHPLVNGGDTVVLSTTGGALSSVRDEGDGTYTATLTAGTTSANATISGTVNGLAIGNEGTVHLEGGAASLLVNAPETVSAGSPFTITVTVRDEAGATHTPYRGAVRVSSDASDAVLPGDHTFNASDAGTYDFTGLVLPTPGSWQITLTDGGSPALTSSFTVEVRGSTTTTLSSDPNPSTHGQQVTLTAIVTAAPAGAIGGSVTFFSNGTSIGTAPVEGGRASLAAPSVEGTYTLMAEYGGDSLYEGSTSAAVTHVVNARPFGAPANFVATATSGSLVGTSWSAVQGAASYQVLRRTGGGAYVLAGTTTSTQFQDASVTPETTYLYFVRAVKASTGETADSNVDPASTRTFLNDPLAPRVTTLKATHITELRSAVNAFRVTAGLSTATFTDPSLSGKPMRVVHIRELRDALVQARAAAGLPAIAFTDAGLSSGWIVKAAHVQELRNAMR